MPPSPRESRGFTLVEMMIVLGVIGVLAAIALAQYGNAMMTSRG